MNLIKTILGAIYLVAMRKKKTLKEAFQASEECLNSALVAEKLNPTNIHFGITKTFFETLINSNRL